MSISYFSNCDASFTNEMEKLPPISEQSSNLDATKIKFGVTSSFPVAYQVVLVQILLYLYLHHLYLQQMCNIKDSV